MKPARLEPPELFQILSDPGRWALLSELARSDRRVGELVAAVGRPQNLVSYHLAELRRAGLVDSRRSSADGRDTYYRVDLAGCRDLLAGSGRALHPGIRLEPAPPGTSLIGRAGRPVVLFLCTGNSARSQMAEALLETRSKGAVRARSAGSHPKPLHPNAVAVMAERGVDIAGRPTRHLSRFSRTRFDRVITLCDKVREICPEFPGPAPAVHWSMADPAAEGTSDAETYPAFVRTAEELEARIEFLIADLASPPNPRRSRAS